MTEGKLTRADLLKAGAAGAIGLTLARPAFARTIRIDGVTLNMLTWSDHYANDQLKAVSKTTQVQGRPTLFSDNADAYLKIKQTGSQFDVVSGDALWVPKYHKDGLTTSFPLSELSVSKQLYPIARQFPFWKDGSNYMGYPFSWSTVQIYYNPKYVTVKPTSWHALLNTKYKGKISLENIPTDVMALAGRAIGSKKPYSMTKGQISDAKDFLKQLKPNVLKLASQNNEVVRALADQSAWIGITNGRPLFNEKAYKILVNGGHGDRARRQYYNQPEKALKMTIKGPPGDEQAYVDAFNEVFG